MTDDFSKCESCGKVTSGRHCLDCKLEGDSGADE